ncbi:interferon-induced protein [Haloferula helveola]|uniref:Interferon-induced protein n=1 Tax=Haloferula helveola TaxID=490095 RepID=A0ABM7RJF5_9BACT|nr:interferon-induced protein [Haloferula helveola]
MQWYYSNNGQQSGPVTEAELRDKIASREIGADDLVWTEGMSEWQSVARTPAVSSALVASQPAPAVPPETLPTQTPSPYQAPVARPSAGGYQGADIPNYMWQSIVVTLFCCQIFGIIAIISAAKVDGFKQAGDLVAARAASDSAKKWCNWGVGLGLLGIVLYIMLMAAAGTSSSM